MMTVKDLTFIDNGLMPEMMSQFRRAVGWADQPMHQYEKAFANSLFSVIAVFDNQVVGIGRLIGDGVMDWYLKDIIVLPDFQRTGVGTAIMEYLMSYIKKNSLPGTTVAVTLMAAKGKEPFYEKLGFRVRPNEREGAGMIQKIRIGDGT